MSPSGDGSHYSAEALHQNDHNSEDDTDDEIAEIGPGGTRNSTKRKRTNTSDYDDGGIRHLTDMVISANSGKTNTITNTTKGNRMSP